MLRSHCWLVCIVGALICGIAPFAGHAQESLTDHDTERAVPRYMTLEVLGNPVQFPSINNRRMVTGTFGETRGFVLLDRFLHPIGFENWQTVILLGNNDRGEIVGLVSRSDSEMAFRYSRGELTSVGVPGSFTTTVRDINNRGDMVGVTQSLSSGEHGFLLSGDQVTLIDGPESDGTTRVFGILVFGLNDRREVVGCYEPRGTIFERRGFVFRKGTYEILQVSGAERTCTTAINNRGQIVGSFSVGGTSDPHYGFLYSKGQYVTIAIPNSRQTGISSINDYGDIVGTYILENSFEVHAFKSNIREFIPRRGVKR
jgi:hypothetical protein